MNDDEWKAQLVKEIKDELVEVRKYIDRKTDRKRDLEQEFLMRLDIVIRQLRTEMAFNYEVHHMLPYEKAQEFANNLDDIYRAMTLFPGTMNRWDMYNRLYDMMCSVRLRRSGKLEEMWSLYPKLARYEPELSALMKLTMEIKKAEEGEA